MMRFILKTLLVIAAFWSSPAMAHFIAGSDTREIHVLDENGGSGAILRFPLTFAFAAALSARTGPNDAVEAPFLKVEYVAGTPFYRFDQARAESDPRAFADWLLKDYRFSAEGREIVPALHDVVVSSGEADRGLTAARALLAQGSADASAGYLVDFDAVLQVSLPGLSRHEALTIEVTTPQIMLPDTMLFDTHVADHRLQPPALISVDGFYPAPITMEPKPFAAAGHWVVQGVEHILFGLDHVLFVLCLVLAATTLRGLVWSVTGFTLGHSVTLSAGVLGFAPQAGWFIPAVELGVAISIVAMAALVLVRRSGPMRFGLAAALGLLHGFGFAFMLAPMLGEAGNGLFVPLAGFNIGVELGQLGIVLLAFAAIWLIERGAPRAGRGMRLATASLAAVIAATMVFERTVALGELVLPETAAAAPVQTEALHGA